MFNKIVWKINFKNPEIIKVHDFFKMFNNWIPDSPEVFVDVADYQHVEDGPLMILVGHYVDYILDHSDRQLGFTYNRKRWPQETTTNKLAQSFSEFINRTEQMLKATELSQQPTLISDELILIENDRAIANNSEESHNKFKPEIEKFCEKQFGKDQYKLVFMDDPKKRFQVKIKLNKLLSLRDE